MITFDKATVEDANISASEDIPLINISVTPKLSELEAFIDKKYKEHLAWRNNNSLLLKDTCSTSEYITAYSTCNNANVNTGYLKPRINTESSTNNNSDTNDA